MNYLTCTVTALPRSFLADVERALAARVTPGPGTGGTGAILEQAARHLTLAPGAKRARPLVVELVGATLGADPARLVDLAAACELIHTASLLHDDVVDEGTLRRGLPTANARFGNAPAVLAGDWVLARALGALQAYPAALTTYAVELVAEMSIGAIAEVECRGNPRLTVAEWEWLAERKCGLLFGFAARSAALIAGRPDLAPGLHEAFTALGVAFQRADDLKDVLDAGAGKDRFADLKNRNPSWALATGAEASPDFAARLAAAWAQPRVPEARWTELGLELVANAGPLVAALQTALDQAMDRTRSLLGDDARGVLAAFHELTWGALPRRAVA